MSKKKYPRKKPRVTISFEEQELANVMKKLNVVLRKRLPEAIYAHLLNLRQRKPKLVIPTGFLDYGHALSTLGFILKGIDDTTLSLADVKDLIITVVTKLSKK